MDQARDQQNGRLSAADSASPTRSYVCPRPGCGGRVYLTQGFVRRPHFRHYPGEGTPACDEYFPGTGRDGEDSVAGVEEDPSELGLLLTQSDRRWGLGLRLPEIPNEEFGEASLGALRSAFVEIYAGNDRLVRVGALELRPGVGQARVDVAPSLLAFRTRPAGSWPASVDRDRWILESRGLAATGTLFRLLRGEWIRLLEGSAVHRGESLLALADSRFAPPRSVVLEAHAPIPSGDLQWTIWEVRLPSDPATSVLDWLDRLGHELVTRPWGVELTTPPRAYDECGEPVLWVGDTPVLTLGAPPSAPVARVDFESDTESSSASVCAAQSRAAYVSVSVRDAGHARLAISGERRASLDFTFVRRPPPGQLNELLAQTARLRIWIGQQALEAWQGPTPEVRIVALEQQEVRVDLGDETARARVTVWENGKQASSRGLDSRGVERVLGIALTSAERVEVDADNLGRLVLLLVHTAPDVKRPSKVRNRLAWHDHAASLGSLTAARTTPALLEQPRAVPSLTPRQVGAAALVRARMALRGRVAAKGSRK